MTNKQLSTILKPLKQKEDTAMPTKKSDLLKRYNLWKDCPPPKMPTNIDLTEQSAQRNDQNEGSLLSKDEGDSIDNDVITAMLSLHGVVDV